MACSVMTTHMHSSPPLASPHLASPRHAATLARMHMRERSNGLSPVLTDTSPATLTLPTAMRARVHAFMWSADVLHGTMMPLPWSALDMFAGGAASRLHASSLHWLRRPSIGTRPLSTNVHRLAVSRLLARSFVQSIHAADGRWCWCGCGGRLVAGVRGGST